MAPAGKHALGSRVSAPFGAKIDPAVFDAGAPQPAGTAGESVRTRRAATFRQRIYGTISASVDKKQWKVKWDSPNYKADANGVLESVEVSTKLRHEPPGAGTGPNSPNAAR